jgi:hypothetical protein
MTTFASNMEARCYQSRTRQALVACGVVAGVTTPGHVWIGRRHHGCERWALRPDWHHNMPPVRIGSGTQALTSCVFCASALFGRNTQATLKCWSLYLQCFRCRCSHSISRLLGVWALCSGASCAEGHTPDRQPRSYQSTIPFSAEHASS